MQLDSGATPRHLQLRRSDRVEWSVEPRPAAASVLFSGLVIDLSGRLKANLGFGPIEPSRGRAVRWRASLGTTRADFGEEGPSKSIDGGGSGPSILVTSSHAR